MHITMVKKRLADGSECRKCQDASATLQSRGLWNRIDEVVWAKEGDDASPGMVLAGQYGVEQAPFFIVRDGSADQVYTSVLQLVQSRLQQEVSSTQQAAAIDPDDIGGI